MSLSHGDQYKDLLYETTSRSMITETEEIFKLFITFISSIETDKAPNLSEQDKKFQELDNRKALFANRVESPMSAKEDSAKRISDLEAKFSTAERSNGELSLKLRSLEHSSGTLVSQVSAIEQTNLNLEAKVSTVERGNNDQLRKLQNILDSTNQYKRRDTLVISGPDLHTHSEDENPKTKIQSLLRSRIMYNLDPSNISAHCIGR